jgi:hypothetical protein
MSRLAAITVFALFLAVPLWAQHGGGHGGGHAGFSGGHAGGFSGGHVSGHSGFSGGHAGLSAGHAGHLSAGMHSAPRGFTHSSGLASSRGSFNRDRFARGHNRFHDRDRFRNFGFRNCNGFGCRGGFGYPWWGAGFYDPWWLSDSGSSYDEDYERDREIANDMNDQSLAEQRMLRQEDADGDQDSYSRRSDRQRSPSPASSDDQQGPAVAPTVLVYRDQHKREIQNYAIVGNTLWNFAPPHTEKIPLADLDLTATAKANDDRGIAFKVPAPGEAQ